MGRRPVLGSAGDNTLDGRHSYYFRRCGVPHDLAAPPPRPGRCRRSDQGPTALASIIPLAVYRKRRRR